LNERDQDPNVVTLSTLHAAKGLECPHVMLVGVNEGLLPFKMDEDNKESINAAVHAEGQLTRLQEERRLMYVGITRAQRTLAVSWTKRRKKGRETIAALPSRFIAEMAREPDNFLGLLALGWSMGQWLSVPMILIGAVIVLRSYQRPQGG
jgi:ATP-dependent DNA helicase Rep